MNNGITEAELVAIARFLAADRAYYEAVGLLRRIAHDFSDGSDYRYVRQLENCKQAFDTLWAAERLLDGVRFGGYQ